MLIRQSDHGSMKRSLEKPSLMIHHLSAKSLWITPQRPQTQKQMHMPALIPRTRFIFFRIKMRSTRHMALIRVQKIQLRDTVLQRIMLGQSAPMRVKPPVITAMAFGFFALLTQATLPIHGM